MAKKTSSSETGAIVSTVSGGAAGAVAAVAGVVAGAAEGTAGAAALTSGLAAVGTVIGGGMFAGIILVAAAPLAFGAVGFGIYKLYKKMATPKCKAS